ncbi:MAG: hypothetical protein AAF191_02130 [Verrucomicrobiota bacterium]
MNQGSSNKRPLSIGIAITMIIAAMFTGTYFLLFVGPADAVKEVAKTATHTADQLTNTTADAVFKIAAALQLEPVVHHDHEVTFETAEGITEFVTASLEFDHEYDWFQEKWNFKKRIHQKGRFRAKMGFAVDEHFRIVASPDGSVITVFHGPPRLISNELLHKEILKESDWYIYPLLEGNRQEADNRLVSYARAAAETNEQLQAEAVANLMEKLNVVEVDEELVIRAKPSY